MIKKTISTGVVHNVPDDLRKALLSSNSSTSSWNTITPLARNEWICWIISAKKPETRECRINRTKQELISGKKRPCCFAGCGHR